MLLRFAEFERDMIRDRIMGGIFDTADLGRWPGGRVPYGYELNDAQQLAIRENEAEIIRRIYAMRADGMPLRRIAILLNDEGSRPRPMVDWDATKAGRVADPDAPEIFVPSTWSLASIRNHIRRPLYMGGGISKELAISGDRDAPKKTFDFPAPAIVAADLWKAANVERRGKKPTGSKASDANIVTPCPSECDTSTMTSKPQQCLESCERT